MELWKQVQGFGCDETGASAVEYAVLAALIIAIAVVIIGVLGFQVENAFDSFVSVFGEQGG